MRLRIWILTVVLTLTGTIATAQEWAVVDSLATDSVRVDSTEYNNPQQKNFNALQFSLDGQHRYQGDRMAHGLNYLEIGGGRMAISDDHHHNPDPFFLMHVRFGRQLNPLSSLRIGVTGGLGFIPQSEKNTFYNSINARTTLQADYLYSLTTHIMGYRPDRILDVSGFIGAGVGYSQLFKSNREDWLSEFNTSRVTGFARGGFQLKFMAGPQAALAIEPYAYVSTNGIDLVRPEYEFYNYRMGYGFDISFIQYLGTKLSDESQAGTFNRRFSRQQRYFASDVPALLHHHPMIVGVQTGVGGVNGDGRTFNRSAGLSQSAYVGWWMSPSIGVRFQFGTVNMKWQETEHSSLKNFAAYRSGAVDLMLNPFGFGRHARWHAPAGVTLLVGYEGGYAFREKGIKGFPAFGYRGGLNLWAQLANGLRLNVEPQYVVMTHKNDNLRASIDYLTRMSVGIEMMIGGDRESEDTGNNLKPFPLGYFIGGGIGRNFTPRFYQETSRERDWVKSGLLFGGYEYSDLHSLRLSGEYMTDVFYHNDQKNRQHRWVFTVGYQLSASNLFRGIEPHRRWNLSTNIGPAVAFGSGTSAVGANAGLTLGYRLGKHFSLFFAQNLYWMPGGLYDSDQPTDANLTCTFNAGLMYHFENLVQPTIQVARTTANAIGAAGVAVGQASVAVGRAVGQAGVTTGRAIGSGAAAVGHAVGQAGVAVGQAGMAAGRAIGAGATAVGHALADVATGIVDQKGHPLFIEYALGYSHINHMPTKGVDTWEPQIQLGIGWWALPAFGLRVGGDIIRGSSKEEEVKTSNVTLTRYDKLRLSYLYADFLLNPIGLAPHYNWQSRAGFNLVCGRTLLNLASRNMEERYWKNGWRLGTQLWAQLDPGLRLTVEPMFSLIKCDPQSDNPDNYTSADHRDVFSLKLGLSMLINSNKKQHQPDADSIAKRHSRWFVAVGGGVHFNKDDFRYGGGGTNSNIQLMAGYRLWKNTAIRLGEELTFDHFIENCSYRLTSGPDAGKQKSGMGINTYRFLFSSLTGQYDLMGLFNPSPKRRWAFNFVLGGTLSYYLGESATIFNEQQSYEVIHSDRQSPLNFNTTVGTMISYKLSDALSAYMNHHVYIYSFGHPQWVHYTSQIWSISGNINTFNLGLMYHF